MLTEYGQGANAVVRAVVRTGRELERRGRRARYVCEMDSGEDGLTARTWARGGKGVAQEAGHRARRGNELAGGIAGQTG